MQNVKQNKKALAGALVALTLIVGIASGCGTAPVKSADGSAAAAPAATATAPAPKESAAPTPEAPKTDAPIELGHKGTNGEYAITIEKSEKSTGGEYSKPKAGKEYVIVHMQIVNEGTNQISYNTFDFKMQDSNGNVVDSEFASDINENTQMEGGELAPGGKWTGTLLFMVPKADPKLLLQWTPAANFDNKPLGYFKIQ